MKKLAIIIKTILILSSNIFHAQNGCTGIYKNAEDFLNRKISYSGKYTRIKLHETFKKDLLEIKFNDSTHVYFKKDLFGYINKDGFTFRFSNNDIYPILNPTEKILIYKQTSGTGMKNYPLVEKYFFSKEAYTEILPLTLRNLENVFSNDINFNMLIEIHFKNDTELAEYDNIHKIYKLNRLLELSNTGEKIN